MDKTQWLEELARRFADVGLNLLYAGLILFVGLRLVKWAARRVSGLKTVRLAEPGVQSFLHSFIIIALDVLVVVTAAITAGIPATTFVTLIASCGVAIGLALQGALSNFAGGLMLLIFHPFKVGDYVVSGEYEGIVKEITVFYTFIVARDHRVVTIPNGMLTGNVVVNCTGDGVRRLTLTFTAGYGQDVDRVKAVILETARADAQVLQDPAPSAALTAQGDSALEYSLYAWCESNDYWALKDRLNENMVKAFNRAGIEIPFPQCDVHMIP